jgi:hypothetical protein
MDAKGRKQAVGKPYTEAEKAAVVADVAGRPVRPPRVSPARGPPQAELDLDQTPVFDLEAPEPIPEYEFDQYPPHDWDA